MKIGSLFATAWTALFVSLPASAADWDDWSLSPYSGEVGDATYTISGQAFGSAFAADQPAAPGLDKWGVTGAASINARVQRDYDSGLSLALKGTFLIYRDQLSGDSYGSDFVQKVYGSLQTGLGRVEVGMSDGAAYALAITGPVANPEVSLDNANATFFRDPSTSAAFTKIFALNSAVQSSLNYAKISYYTPRLFGVQLGASFTPSEGKDVIPFLNKGPNVPDRQADMWEAAINYNDYLGPVAYAVYAGLTVGHNDAKTIGHKGLTDWAVGAQADWNVNDDVKWSLGGAYRKADTYAFDINNAFNSGDTTSIHLSSTVTYEAWTAGAELGLGTSDGFLGAPTLGAHAYLLDVAYAVNTNLQLTAGWQKLNYHRSIGTFYNGAPRVTMDAEFLHAILKI